MLPNEKFDRKLLKFPKLLKLKLLKFKNSKATVCPSIILVIFIKKIEEQKLPYCKGFITIPDKSFG